MLRYSLIFLIILFTSCGSRKVTIDKTDTVVKIDSTSSTKKEEVTTTQNNIIVNEDIDEIEITPIDSAKPVVIGDKKYVNAKIKIKKVKTNIVDTSKKEEVKKESQDLSLKKDKSEKVFKKQIDKKESSSIYWWWIVILLLLALYFYARHRLSKYLL